jgi:hypothetical protein
MKIEEFVNGKLVESRSLSFDPDISNCLKELEADGIEVEQSKVKKGFYYVMGNAGQRFELYDDESGRPKMHIPGRYHSNIADFKHLAMEVYEHQWRAQPPIAADPVWRALFLRFGFAREIDGVLIPVQ